MPPRDGDLFVGRVAVEADHLHAIEERRRNGLVNVRRRDKQHLRQVELDVEVVIAEGVVLRRVEDLEQRRRRIAAPVGADLVDLVEQDHRVHAAGVAQRAHQPSREGADIRAPMAADFGFVADAAERHPDELPARGPRDRLADRRLAGPRRPDQGQDHARTAIVGHAAFGAELAHRQVLGDAALHIVEPLVVRVENRARVGGIEPLFRTLRPRNRQQPVQVGPNRARLGVGVAHALEAGQLAIGLLAHRVGHACVGNLLAILVHDGAVVLAELLANRVHLLAKEILALLLLRAVLDIVADPLAHLQLGEAFALELERERQPFDDVERFEQLDLLREGEVGRIAGGIGERAGVGDRRARTP